MLESLITIGGLILAGCILLPLYRRIRAGQAYREALRHRSEVEGTRLAVLADAKEAATR